MEEGGLRADLHPEKALSSHLLGAAHAALIVGPKRASRNWAGVMISGITIIAARAWGQGGRKAR
eukprot:9487080-Pyramimonas_sp.AAC.1